jgi:hypothetical protein
MSGGCGPDISGGIQRATPEKPAETTTGSGDASVGNSMHKTILIFAAASFSGLGGMDATAALAVWEGA